MAKRRIIKIDKDKCIGCGQCIQACPMGVIEIKDGKAHVVNEPICDGIGKCIGGCPLNAIEFIEKDIEENLPCGCPGTMAKDFREISPSGGNAAVGALFSELRQWPLQLKLVSPNASYFDNADIVVAADCTAFTFGDFHRRFLKNKTLVVFCPKLDNDIDMYREKLTAIFRDNNVSSVTVVRMEVPCCSGIVGLTETAARDSGKNIIIKEYTISIRGEIV
ncbi:MAG: 4Fe-4S binding protein [Candidatus Kaelpia aquatica]|nr:4Fe-4S binding protein [Candidatus Kaelpia aquatica]